MNIKKAMRWSSIILPSLLVAVWIIEIIKIGANKKIVIGGLLLLAFGTYVAYCLRLRSCGRKVTFFYLRLGRDDEESLWSTDMALLVGAGLVAGYALLFLLRAWRAA